MRHTSVHHTREPNLTTTKPLESHEQFSYRMTCNAGFDTVMSHPFRACQYSENPYPGRHPGLVCDTPSGLVIRFSLKKNLIIPGDGSILQTVVSPHGIPTCDCRENGIYKCGHDKFPCPVPNDHGSDKLLIKHMYFHLTPDR